MTLETEYVDAIITGNNGKRARLHDELDAATAADTTRLDAPEALRLAAHWYATVGIAIFPLKPRDKTPATPHGFKDATTDPDVIDAWWNANPAYNIGAPTGLTFDVIDIDGPIGVTSWLHIWDHMPALIGHATTSRDAGHHLYVTPVEGRGNKASMMPGVDYRGAGGYVVMPPSIGANGRRYRWLTPLKVTA